MQNVRLLFASVLTVLLASCATIINGSTESVDLFSNVNDTNVYVNGVLIGSAGPDSALKVIIPKKGRVEFVGKKPNCESAETIVRRTIDPATFLGLLIDGGIVSILFVDIIGTNAFVRATEKSYFLHMECETGRPALEPIAI